MHKSELWHTLLHIALTLLLGDRLNAAAMVVLMDSKLG